MSTDISSVQRLVPTSHSGSSAKPSGGAVGIVASANPSLEKVKTEEVEGKDLTAVGQAMAAKAQAEEEQVEAVDASEVTEAVEFVNSQVQSYTRNLEFSVEEDTGETVVRVYDTETEELVRQIPSEDMVELVRRLQEHREASSDSVEGLLLKVTA